MILLKTWCGRIYDHRNAQPWKLPPDKMGELSARDGLLGKAQRGAHQNINHLAIGPGRKSGLASAMM